MRCGFSLLLVAFGASACSEKSTVHSAPTTVPSEMAQSPSAGPLSSAPPGPLARTVFFERAASTRDPLDLAALANQDGASNLTERMNDPEQRAVAVEALGYAADAELAYSRLARDARSKPGSMPELDAIGFSLEHPTRREEILDDEGIHAAITDLKALSADASRAEEERNLASSLLKRFAERGFR